MSCGRSPGRQWDLGLTVDELHELLGVALDGIEQPLTAAANEES